MGNKKSTKEEMIARLEGKKKKLDAVAVASFALTVLSVPTMIASASGVIANDIAASQERTKIRNSVNGTKVYETFVDSKKQQLKDAFYNGEMSYADFKTQYDNLALFDTVREFAEETDNEILKKQFAVVDKFEDQAEKYCDYGVSGALAIGAAGGLAYTLNAAFMLKNKSDLEKAKEENTEAEMA